MFFRGPCTVPESEMTAMNERTISIRKISIPDDILSVLPSALAHRLGILPLNFENDILTVAVSPEKDFLDILDQAESQSGLVIEGIIADSAEELKTAVRRYYPSSIAGESATADGLFRIILNRALQLRASDIHICPDEDGADIQLRIDGETVPGHLPEPPPATTIDFDFAQGFAGWYAARTSSGSGRGRKESLSPRAGTIPTW
ncbi:MAG: hypothetical protein EOM69_01635 [Clostridia bacterium]|nr:hypothetical protein [Clostridia bacterium]